LSKKVVFVHLFNDRSGSPKVLSQVASVLSGRGIETEMITSKADDGFLRGIADRDRVVFYKRTESTAATLFFYILSQAHLFFLCLKYWRIDVVFYVNTLMPVGAALAAKMMGKSVVYHIHETSIKPRIFKRFLRFVVSLTADKIIFVSDYLKRVETFGRKDECVIHNSLSYYPNVLPIKTECFGILMICSLKKYKGVFEFFQLAEFLKEDARIKFTLVLNVEDKEIDRFFAEDSIPSNVELFSRQSDLTQFYRDASLVLNLSRPDGWVETFGLTLIEAFSFGVPVIAPVVGGPVEIVRDGLDGYLIDSAETTLIAAKIRTLSQDGAAWDVMSRNAAQRAGEFSFPVFERDILAALSSKLRG